MEILTITYQDIETANGQSESHGSNNICIKTSIKIVRLSSHRQTTLLPYLCRLDHTKTVDPR